MKLIPLSQGLSSMVDDEKYDELSQYKWYAAQIGGSPYAVRNINTINGQRQMRMHREILRAPGDSLVDHINHNTLDNRKENLRLATTAQNCQNRKYKSENRLKGVCYRPRNPNKPWNANFWDGKKFKSLGHFKTELEAHSAYKEKALQRHKEFFHE